MPKPRPFRIAHLSDLHLTASDRAARSETRLFGRLRGMNAAFRKIVRTPAIQRADLIVFTGDIADRGEIDAWKVFWNALAEAGLSHRALVVPGNHDVCCLGVRAPWNADARADWAKAAAGLRLGNQPTKLPWARSPDPRVAVFGLNSNNLGNFSAADNALGRIGYYQLQDLANKLHVHRDVPVKIVLLHHSPNIPEDRTAAQRGQRPTGPLGRATHQIPRDQRRALRLLCITHRVRLVLHGHMHVAEDRRVAGVHTVGARATTEPDAGKYYFSTFVVLGEGHRVWRKPCAVRV
ncbi:MAG: metallophosphoesterase [Pirellulales bacterium]|nr:metallophosphoesterase [Pirellulales bacterium]